MWNSKKPWWQRKAKDNNPAENSHYKNWCVVKVAHLRMSQYQWGQEVVTVYKPCAKLNAPKWLDADGKTYDSIAVDNLTKHEAHCVAKGLNFLDKE